MQHARTYTPGSRDRLLPLCSYLHADVVRTSPLGIEDVSRFAPDITAALVVAMAPVIHEAKRQRTR